MHKELSLWRVNELTYYLTVVIRIQNNETFCIHCILLKIFNIYSVQSISYTLYNIIQYKIQCKPQILLWSNLHSEIKFLGNIMINGKHSKDHQDGSSIFLYYKIISILHGIHNFKYFMPTLMVLECKKHWHLLISDKYKKSYNSINKKESNMM